ncbi:hypothetical protein [Pseudactinotalea sp. Z1748]|uniref:hypothetical protein n=1 Tax=Pseudactinotalea sp. Z1748 TaxID=3413027 RepID=UPI003C7DE900
MTTGNLGELAAAIEALLLPPEGPASCVPVMFGHWPGGKPLDEWFTADSVSGCAGSLQVSLDEGQDVLTVEHAGAWWSEEDSVVVSTARRVHLRTHRTYPPQAYRPWAPRAFTRTMDYRTAPGVVIDSDGSRARWYPPDASPRPWHVGASRAPALELRLLWPLTEADGTGRRER